MGLLLVEGATLFAAAVTTVFLWGSPHRLDWIAPLLALIALAIKLDSRGPVFFIHERAGYHGRPFRLVKFRTMPRPEMVENIKVMADLIPYYSLRHVVRPRLTGWAQVRYGYSVSLEQVTEKMRYDLFYIKPMSFWLDLRTLVDTLKIALFGRGAQ